MSEQDLAFEQMLAEHNQNYKEAEEYSDWMPPDNRKDECYTVTVVKGAKGVSAKEGQEAMGWWKLTGRIEAPENEELNGKEFTLGFYNTKAMGILKGQARALNGGEPVTTLQEANTVFESAVGKILTVKVATTVSKKNGNEYTNCYIQDVLAVTDATTPEEPPQS